MKFKCYTTTNPQVFCEWIVEREHLFARRTYRYRPIRPDLVKGLVAKSHRVRKFGDCIALAAKDRGVNQVDIVIERVTG